MRNGNYEQNTVDQMIARVPESRDILRGYGIDPTSRMSLSQAAAAVSANTDELLAIVEDRARRVAARQAELARRNHVEDMKDHEEEFDLIA